MVKRMDEGLVNSEEKAIKERQVEKIWEWGVVPVKALSKRAEA